MMSMSPPDRRVSYRHCGSEMPLIGEPIDPFVRRVADEYAERDAVVSIHQGARLTYAELDRAVRPSRADS